uniref:Putative secreted peptide n=1 Tax=Anopheles braziliensis TaxID=58242 RepID=A0A2M3ZP44_9DIPT
MFARLVSVPCSLVAKRAFAGKFLICIGHQIMFPPERSSFSPNRAVYPEGHYFFDHSLVWPSPKFACPHSHTLKALCKKLLCWRIVTNSLKLK